MSLFASQKKMIFGTRKMLMKQKKNVVGFFNVLMKIRDPIAACCGGDPAMETIWPLADTPDLELEEFLYILPGTRDGEVQAVAASPDFKDNNELDFRDLTKSGFLACCGPGPTLGPDS